MKKYLQFAFLVFSLLSLNSCDLVNHSNDDNDLIGKWSDNIKLSAKTVDLNSSEGSVTIKTGGTWWWVASISIDDHHYYDFDGVNMELSTYSIQRGGVTFQRVDEHTISITVDENLLETDRVIRISLQAGDYFDGITIKQKSGAGI